MFQLSSKHGYLFFLKITVPNILLRFCDPQILCLASRFYTLLTHLAIVSFMSLSRYVPITDPMFALTVCTWKLLSMLRNVLLVLDNFSMYCAQSFTKQFCGAICGALYHFQEVEPRRMQIPISKCNHWPYLHFEILFNSIHCIRCNRIKPLSLQTSDVCIVVADVEGVTARLHPGHAGPHHVQSTFTLLHLHVLHYQQHLLTRHDSWAILNL